MFLIYSLKNVSVLSALAVKYLIPLTVTVSVYCICLDIKVTLRVVILHIKSHCTL